MLWVIQLVYAESDTTPGSESFNTAICLVTLDLTLLKTT